MPVPSSFKAALLNKDTPKHALADRSLNPLGSEEVGIKITATAINPVDWKIRDYGIFLQSFPAVLGSDAAGQVVAVGDNVSGLSVGDRVFFQGIIGNEYDASTFQEYCKLPAALVGKTPASISDDQAAGVCLATVAAVTGLYDHTGRGLAPPPWAEGGSRAGSGKAIVVLGGSSSVGQYVIQMARLSGYTRIVTNASLVHEELLKNLGAHVVLDRKRAGAQDLVAALDGLPLDFVFDSISLGETQKLGVEILQAAGIGSCVVTVLHADAEAQSLGASKEPKVEVRTIIGIGSKPELRYLSEPLMKHLGGEDGWLATGQFVPNRIVVVDGGLDKLDEALDKNKAGVSGEKVIIRP